MAASPRSASRSTAAVRMARSASWLRGRPRGAPGPGPAPPAGPAASPRGAASPGISLLISWFYHEDPKRSVTYLIGIMPVTAPSNRPELTTATPAATRAPTPNPPRRQPLQLALILVAAFMVVLDFSIVNVALPSIERELHMPADAVQWIVTGYAISFGGLLILGARAADLLGRRRMFVIGLVAFAIASLAGGLAQDPVLLIAA